MKLSQKQTLLKRYTRSVSLKKISAVLAVGCMLALSNVITSSAVNINDLENAYGFSYMYRMNGQQYYAQNSVEVRPGEGNSYEIIAKTYSHQGAMYYMTEYVNHYYFNQEDGTIHWMQDEINLVDARTGALLRKEFKKHKKLRLLKPDTYGYIQAEYFRNIAIAAGQLKEVN